MMSTYKKLCDLNDGDKVWLFNEETNTIDTTTIFNVMKPLGEKYWSFHIHRGENINDGKMWYHITKTNICDWYYKTIIFADVQELIDTLRKDIDDAEQKIKNRNELLNQINKIK